MKLSLINKLLNNELNVEELKNNIHAEVGTYKKQVEKRGSSIDINVVQDIPAFLFAEPEFKKLIKFFEEGSLEKFELSYIADCLLLAENVIFIKEELLDDLEAYTFPQG